MAKRQKKAEVSSLEQALQFLSMNFKVGEAQTMHSRMENGTAVTFNMVVGLGTPIDIDLCACPQVDLMLAAVQRCGPTLAITQLSPHKLVVRSQDFHAYVPCIDPAACSWPKPDTPIAEIGADFIGALHKVAPFTDAKGETVLESSIQLLDGSVLATNRSVVVEAWHGTSMPEGLLIPVEAAKLLHKSKKELRLFGYSPTTITFYFADNSWLRTQLFQDKLPNIKAHIERASQEHMHDVPHDFFAAVEKVAPFSTSGKIWIENNLVSSHPFDAKEEGSGLALEFAGNGHAYRVYAASDLHKIRKIATKWDEFGRDDGTLFFGEKIRGMIWHQKKAEPLSSAEDDDIPF